MFCLALLVAPSSHCVSSTYHCLFLSVFHRHICGGGCDETDGNEPQVLLQGGLEHLRLYHRVPLPPGAGHGQRLRSIRPQIFQTGELK